MSLLGRARQLGRALGTAQQTAAVSSSLARDALQQGSSMSQAAQWQARRFASGGGHGEGVTYAGLTLHKASPGHVWAGKLMGATMWFWVFYRFYHDHEVFLYGHARHWEHEMAHEKEHGEGHH